MAASSFDERSVRPASAAAASAASAAFAPPVVPTLTGAFALAGLAQEGEKIAIHGERAFNPGGAGVLLATATTARMTASTGAGELLPAAANEPSV